MYLIYLLSLGDTILQAVLVCFPSIIVINLFIFGMVFGKSWDTVCLSIESRECKKAQVQNLQKVISLCLSFSSNKQSLK